MYIFIDIYRVYSFCTTLPIVWQSLCDLGSCKAMILVKFIGLSCLFFFFFFKYFYYVYFFFLSLTSFVSSGGERRGPAPTRQLECREPEDRVWLLFQSRQSVSVLPSPAVAPVWEYWRKNIRYCKSRETERGAGGRERPLRGHATSGGQETNRRRGSSHGWARSRWTDNDDEEMRWSPCPCPREIDGVD